MSFLGAVGSQSSRHTHRSESTLPTDNPAAVSFPGESARSSVAANSPLGWIGWKRITDPVTPAEEDQSPAAHFPHRRRRPVAVEGPRADPFAFPGQEPARGLVHHNQAGGFGLLDRAVLAVEPIVRVQVEIRTIDENGSMARIVRTHSGGRPQIQQPEDVGVRGADFHGRLVPRGHVASLVAERTVVPVGHSSQVQAHHLVPIGDDIHPIALYGGRRADARLGPIEIDVSFELRHDELPRQAAVRFVQAHQHAAVAAMPRIAGLAVVGADEHLAPGDDRRGVTLRAQRGGPLDVLAGLRVETIGQAGF